MRETRHEVPPLRKERQKAMKLLVIMCVLFIALMAVAATNAAGRSADREAPTSAPAVTPPPSPAPETWTRYPVPLDDDLQRYIRRLCIQNDVHPALVLAIISRESDYQADKLGDNGESYGLMQIHLEDHRERCIRLEAYNLFDPYANVRVGIDFLGELMAEGKGVTWTVMAYNAGQGKADEWAARDYTSPYAEDVVERALELLRDGEEVRA